MIKKIISKMAKDVQANTKDLTLTEFIASLTELQRQGHGDCIVKCKSNDNSDDVLKLYSISIATISNKELSKEMDCVLISALDDGRIKEIIFDYIYNIKKEAMN